jgi:hypothetical protein
MTITVEPDNPYSTHQVKLTHRGTSLGLITCDFQGEPGVRKIDIDPIPSSAMKTYSGMQQYADMVPPWTPIGQNDFRGGWVRRILILTECGIMMGCGWIACCREADERARGALCFGFAQAGYKMAKV